MSKKTNSGISYADQNKTTPRVRYDFNKHLIVMSQESNTNIIERSIELRYELAPDEKKLIVIVDDHKLIRETTKNLLINVLKSLNMENFSFIEASDGIDLLNIIKTDYSKRIKCIFVDENMEYLNGSEAVKIIRNLENNKKIPQFKMVSITAFDDLETKKNILGAGFDLIVPKPCSKSILTEILNDLDD
jgi:CheY-like chemotaxis protein